MPDQTTHVYDFFIDYHQADISWAKWIVWQLRDAGYSVVDQQDFQPGTNRVLRVDEAMNTTKRLLILLSPDYLREPTTDNSLSGGTIWSAMLIQDARGREGKLVPIRVRECTLNGLLAPLIAIDLIGKYEHEARFLLLSFLSTATEETSISPPPFPGRIEGQEMNGRPSRYPGTLPTIWNVPGQNRIFTDRDPALVQLYEVFKEEQEGEVLTHVVNGLGGIGKTQVVIEYAHRYSHRYDAVLWIDASSEQTFTKHLMILVQQLKLQISVTRGRLTLDLNTELKQAVKQWLQTQSGETRWLLIIDNIDSLREVHDFLPSGGNGHVLLTVREQAIGTIAPSRLKLIEMPPEEGALLLLRRARIINRLDTLQQASESDRAAALEICRLLGNLPLALDQAGASLEQRIISDLVSYITYFEDSSLRRDLLHMRGDTSFDHPDSIATTWNGAFTALRSTNQVAYDLLLFCAFLHCDSIPEEVITLGIEKLQPFQSIAHHSLRRRQAIAALNRYSLLDEDTVRSTYSIQKLVQTVLRDSLSKTEKCQWATHAVAAVYHGLQFARQSNHLLHCCPRYLSHVQSCANNIKEWQIKTEEAVHLLTLMGTDLHDLAHNTQAMSTIAFGSAAIVDTLMQYADLLQDMGRLQEAEQLASLSDHVRAAYPM